MKQCNKCLEFKEENENNFYRNSRNKNIFDTICKCCHNKKSKEYTDSHKEDIKKYKSEYYKDNEKVIKNNGNQYYLDNKDNILVKRKEHYINNKESKKLINKRWRLNNKERSNEYHRLYMEDRLHNDIEFKLKNTFRHRIYTALTLGVGTKAHKTTELLGCSVEEAKRHLETLFQEGMTWSNHGLWHIDHIRPCASFDLTDPEQQKECFNYNNLQPLWAEDNLRKGRKNNENI